MSGLGILSIAASATIQDQGRVGYLRYGVTGGGAMDIFALTEGQVLLGNDADDAALEFAGYGGQFRADGPLWLTTSGAEMAIRLNGTAVQWRQNLLLAAGDVLEIGAAIDGVYGYLHVPGGFRTEVVLGARSTNLRAEIGYIPRVGESLPIGDAGRPCHALRLPRPDYYDLRTFRVMWGPQSEYFSKEERARFLAARFEVSKMRDRMGVQIIPDSGPFHSAEGLTIASDAINPGDIQITGDGTPAVLLADRGSSGGYPRIATLITADISALAQVPSGESFGFVLVSREQAVAALADFRRDLGALKGRCVPITRDPRDIADLLAYNLIDGVLRGDEHDDC